MITRRRRRSSERRRLALETARSIVQGVADDTRDTYEGYRHLYGIYTGTSGLLSELKPLFRLPGTYPDGPLTVNDEFRRAVIFAAENWLREHSKD